MIKHHSNREHTLDCQEKNLFTNFSDSETSTSEINLRENSTDSKRSKIHWQTSAMNKPNGEQGSVTVGIFKLSFMRTDVMLQVSLRIKKRIDTLTLGVLKKYRLVHRIKFT